MTDLLGDDGLLDLRRRGRGSRTDPDAFVEEARRHRTQLPEANAELAAWARERTPAGAAPEPDRCHRCTRPPRLRCNSCGKPTCAAHSWVMLGVCRDCATEDRMKRWHGSRVSERNWLEDG